MYPTIEQARALVAEAEELYPGPWGDHCRTAAHCAQAIAERCEGMDADKAYVLGLLHDIGRRFGHRHMGHVIDGYRYMMELGYDEVARVCLTHSFNTHVLDDYIGKRDTTDEEYETIKTELEKLDEFDDYDRLIQLCDSIAGPGYVMDQIQRMSDVKARYGDYSQRKWDSNIDLRTYFEGKMNMDLYEAVDKEHFTCRDTAEKFRFATAYDTGLILHFIKELAAYEHMLDEVVADPEVLKHWIFEEKKAEVIFAMEGGREVGFALFFHNFSTFLGKAGIYLEDLYVMPEYRGRGYGKALITKLAQIAVERGCGRLEWWCLDWNRPSIDFYLSLGAEPMKDWTVYRIAGDTLAKLGAKEN